MTASDAEPLAVKVFQGNPSDPNTVAEQVKSLMVRFVIAVVVFVGDRGMVKAGGEVSLSSAGFKDITTLNDPWIRRLMKGDVLRIGMFDDTIRWQTFNYSL